MMAVDSPELNQVGDDTHDGNGREDLACEMYYMYLLIPFRVLGCRLDSGTELIEWRRVVAGRVRLEHSFFIVSL